MFNSKSIYINPYFKGQLTSTDLHVNQHSTSSFPKSAHINPLFLESPNHSHAIHMNPKFLKKFEVKMQPQNQQEKHSPLKYVPNILTKNLQNDSGKIICKSKNFLIREPAKHTMQSNPSIPLAPLLVLNKRKLVRKFTSVSFATSKALNCDNLSGRKTRYRLDNRMIKKKVLLPPTPKIKRSSFVQPYAFRRYSLSISTNVSMKSSLPVNKNNKKLHVLNINGLLYKSTKNSLKLKDVTVKDKNDTITKIAKTVAKQRIGVKKTLRSDQGLTIFVRGTKYVMDANKFKLTRVTDTDNSLSKIDTKQKPNTTTCKRIDIGGYTYVNVNSSKNVLIRTTNHISRAYINNAKQKSVQFLTKHLVKTNITCPIYQRLGKCSAFERGKCPKVHNKHQIAICNKFLRGECHDSTCLLSHSVSLSKMPVCKFFLQGVCVRYDCPYLHKKLSKQAELCTDFLRGFCQQADKCNKRHEFVCPEIEKNNKCTARNCIYCNAKRRKESQNEKKLQRTKAITNLPSSSSSIDVKEYSCKRYYVESCSEGSKGFNEHDCHENDCYIEASEENPTSVGKIRTKLGALPSYIPL